MNPGGKVSLDTSRRWRRAAEGTRPLVRGSGGLGTACRKEKRALTSPSRNALNDGGFDRFPPVEASIEPEGSRRVGNSIGWMASPRYDRAPSRPSNRQRGGFRIVPCVWPAVQGQPRTRRPPGDPQRPSSRGLPRIEGQRFRGRRSRLGALDRTLDGRGSLRLPGLAAGPCSPPTLARQPPARVNRREHPRREPSTFTLDPET